ncbi:MAG: hypothetical protein NTV34_10925 [Proteobacteria bacterium]|nr:hypothetical protein [Pseudomonadota bacterium]
MGKNLTYICAMALSVFGSTVQAQSQEFLPMHVHPVTTCFNSNSGRFETRQSPSRSTAMASAYNESWGRCEFFTASKPNNGIAAVYNKYSGRTEVRESSLPTGIAGIYNEYRSRVEFYQARNLYTDIAAVYNIDRTRAEYREASAANRQIAAVYNVDRFRAEFYESKKFRTIAVVYDALYLRTVSKEAAQAYETVVGGYHEVNDEVRFTSVNFTADVVRSVWVALEQTPKRTQGDMDWALSFIGSRRPIKDYISVLVNEPQFTSQVMNIWNSIGQSAIRGSADLEWIKTYLQEENTLAQYREILSQEIKAQEVVNSIRGVWSDLEQQSTRSSVDLNWAREYLKTGKSIIDYRRILISEDQFKMAVTAIWQNLGQASIRNNNDMVWAQAYIVNGHTLSDYRALLAAELQK